MHVKSSNVSVAYTAKVAFNLNCRISNVALHVACVAPYPLALSTPATQATLHVHLKAHVHPNGFARLCFCFEMILLSNAVF